MRRATYSDKYKAAMVRRMTGPDAINATRLAKEEVPSQPVLSQWLRQAREVGLESYYRDMTMDDSSSFSLQRKFELLLLSQGLDGADLGAFLRQHGLHKEQLDQWNKTILGALNTPTLKPLTRKERAQEKRNKKRILQLERELNRKDKALAETAALLVLQKKVQDLWGDEETSIPQSNGKLF